MKKLNEGEPLKGKSFKPVKTSARKAGTQPKGAKAIVSPTGATVLSTKPSGMLIQTAKADGLPQHEFVVWFGVDLESGCVGVYPEKPGYPESTMVRVGQGGKVVKMHLGPVFDEHPDLRPSTRVDAISTLEPDEQGRMVLSIQLKGALPHVTIPRDPSTTAAKKTDKSKLDKTKTDNKNGNSNQTGTGQGTEAGAGSQETAANQAAAAKSAE